MPSKLSCAWGERTVGNLVRKAFSTCQYQKVYMEATEMEGPHFQGHSPIKFACFPAWKSVFFGEK